MRPRNDFFRLVLILVASAWAATRAARLTLDVENRSMHPAEGAEARAEARRNALFGHDATVVFLLESGATGTGEAEDAPEDASENWREALCARPEVDRSLPLADENEGELLLGVTLHPDASGGVGAALESLTAFARRTAPPGARLSVSGSPVAEAAIAAALDHEQRRIVPLVGLALFLLLLGVYRSVFVALGVLLPSLGGIAWTGALQQVLGDSVNPVTSLLPPVLLAVGVAGAVHLVDAFLDERGHGLDCVAASRRAVRAILAPAVACAGTTILGFGALATNPIPAIEHFGALASAGVLATTVLGFAFLPPWLRLFARSEHLIRRAAGHGPWRRTSAGMARRLARLAPAIVALAVVSAAVLAWQWTRLEVDTDPQRILPAHHPFRVATGRIGERLGGVETFDLLLEPPGPAGGLLPLLGLQQALLAVEGVVGPGGPPRVATDGTGLVTVLLAPAGSAARERTFAAAEALARERGWSDAAASGAPVRVARDSGAIARGERRGLLATFLALGPCIWLSLRSVRLTLAGLLANTLPCLLLHGGLALAGRPLSVASAMIGSVVLGLVVDDAIYFLHGFRAERASSFPRVAVAHTLQRSGRAMTVTSLVLALGFLVGLTGELATTREFGLLASGSILAAWGANLVLLPSLLLLRRARARGPVR